MRDERKDLKLSRMFERRLKIFLLILFAMTIVLAGRALQLQVFARQYWRDRAADVMKKTQMIETTRGRILDHKQRLIAVDKACIDACVDYRAIVPMPDEAWIRSIARKRLLARPDSEYRRAVAAQKKQLLEHEIEQVKLDIRSMWQHLSLVADKRPEEIDDIRQSIIRKVQMRRRYVWFQRYEQARKGHEQRDPSPWYRRWLIDENDAPELDQFSIEVAEQTESHVILRAISTEIHNELGKNLAKYPGLELRASTHRVYPYGAAGAHILGHLSRVNREDLINDAHIGNDLRAYQPNDLIGRSGLEALCEKLLRGQRGRVERALGEDARILQTRDPVPGMDVECTIDIELQRDIEQLFQKVKLRGGPHASPWEEELEMPGAAVVIDVPTGEIRALATWPGYDPNLFDDLYEQLARDDLRRPLMNRATQFQLEPGSTVKPIVGLGAITQGLAAVDETIECTGYLRLDGRTYQSMARCWVASNFAEIGNVAHHRIPWDAPHPTGFLNFTDAIERSCNIYFETLADRLKIEGLSIWFERFGLGRSTGIGIAEVEGRLPNEMPLPGWRRRAAAWFSGIGQDQILATPLQMANVAATIARDGVWVRPRLVPAGTEIEIPGVPKHPHPDPLPEGEGVERVDLKLSKAALHALRQGMTRAVNSRAGTGQSAMRDDMLVAGKTGSAQAQLLSLPQRDELGRVVRDEKGRPIWERLEPIGTHAAPNPLAPWYRATGSKETGRAHAWFIGFAPADHPQVAFAVLVEYGGSGGTAAGGIARRLLDACVKHGYLSPHRDVARTQ